MSDDELFADLPVQKDERVSDPGQPRMREPVRDQIELRAVIWKPLWLRSIGFG
jgi:hypothetical protein